MAKKKTLYCPKSPTSLPINCIGLALSFGAVAWLRTDGAGIASHTWGIVICCLALALPIIVLEWIFLKPYTYSSAYMQFHQNKKGDWGRTVTKLVGYYACIGAVATVYWLFPEYRGGFYSSFFTVVKKIVWGLMLVAIPYFYFVDKYMPDPKDAYWHLGAWLTGRGAKGQGRAISQLFLGWLVKLFFLPLMFVYMGGNLRQLLSYDYSQLFLSFQGFYDFSYNFLFYIDLLFVTVGYSCSIKLFDSHIRSTEPTFLGWVIALFCYQPHWSSISRNYLAYDVGNSSWGRIFWDTSMYSIWGIVILLLLGIYVWATLCFGIRFSNLTNRGILTNGPYRFTKHPAYVSKNLAWWMISMPFLAQSGPLEGLRLSILLLLLNFIYFMRARTEERHLSADPDYVAYATYINEKGIFSPIGRLLPILKYKQGRLFNVGPEAEPFIQLNARVRVSQKEKASG